MEYYDKSELIKAGVREEFRNGSSKYAARRCYGYDTTCDGSLVINPSKAKIVRWMFQRYLHGDSLGRIAAGLEKQGGVRPFKFYGSVIIKRFMLSFIAKELILCTVYYLADCGNYANIVCMHIGKAHIHNHITWNATALDEQRKLRDFWCSIRTARHLNDTTCVENGNRSQGQRLALRQMAGESEVALRLWHKSLRASRNCWNRCIGLGIR